MTWIIIISIRQYSTHPRINGIIIIIIRQYSTHPRRSGLFQGCLHFAASLGKTGSSDSDPAAVCCCCTQLVLLQVVPAVVGAQVRRPRQDGSSDSDPAAAAAAGAVGGDPAPALSANHYLRPGRFADLNARFSGPEETADAGRAACYALLTAQMTWRTNTPAGDYSAEYLQYYAGVLCRIFAVFCRSVRLLFRDYSLALSY